MQIHQILPVKVVVRDEKNAFTDDLQGGELELQVLPPSNRIYHIPATKDFPNAVEGIFQVDFDPNEIGRHRLMLKYNDQDVQSKPIFITVEQTHFKHSE